MTARADFAVKQGTTVPLTFAVLDGKGQRHRVNATIGRVPSARF